MMRANACEEKPVGNLFKAKVFMKPQEIESIACVPRVTHMLAKFPPNDKYAESQKVRLLLVILLVLGPDGS